MAFENLFVRTERFLGTIKLDAVLQEIHENTVTVSQNPVEFGADIADHAIVQPKKLRMLAQVSDTPLGTEAFRQLVDNVTGRFGTSTEENLTRSVAAYQALLEMMNNKEPLEIQTRLVVYNNMLITSLNVAQDKNTSRVVALQMVLEEVIIVQSENVKLSEEQLQIGTPQLQGTSPATTGSKEALIPEDGVNRSVAKTIKDWLTDD